MMRTARFIATLVFVFSSALQLDAQTKPSGDSSRKQDDQEARMHHVVATLVDLPMGEGQAPLRMDLLQLMKLYNVPGLSVAVIDDYKVVWAKGYGVIETGSSTPVTPKTLFQAGSISKPVAATGALYLVEHGKLALDENVNAKLKTWKVPDNEFTTKEKVTLRRLMSHTAGLTVHGFPGYDVKDAMPTLVQIFNGEKPANTEPIRVDTVPGHNRTVFGRRGDDRAAALDRRKRQGVSCVDARTGAGQSRHGGKQLRAATASRTSGDDGQRDVFGREGGSW
jgi:CubicO group peptidase (beta-lactamase class C family)